jgi:hypothetical protein
LRTLGATGIGHHLRRGGQSAVVKIVVKVRAGCHGVTSSRRSSHHAEVAGQVPVPFELAIDAADVDERADIAVWARLRSTVGTWVSDTHTPVLTRGAGNTADVLVRRTTDT